MLYKAKYIITSENEIIIFSPSISHVAFKHMNPISAGFIYFGKDNTRTDGKIFCSCYGESETLNLKSREEEDENIAMRHIIGLQ